MASKNQNSFVSKFDKLKKSLLAQVISIVIATATITSSVMIFFYENRIEMAKEENQVEIARLKQEIENYQKKAELAIESIKNEKGVEITRLQIEIEHSQKRIELMMESTRSKEEIIKEKWELLEIKKGILDMQKELRNKP